MSWDSSSDAIRIARDAAGRIELRLDSGTEDLFRYRRFFTSGSALHESNGEFDSLQIAREQSRYTLPGQKHHVTISFSDSAPGVTDSELKRLFDRLYRADESRNRVSGGSGLGLSICKAIVEAHLGEIVAQPSHLGGISIRISLPRRILEESQS